MSNQCGKMETEPTAPLKYSVDVVVFGGGITGLMVAHELSTRNFCVAVVEPEYLNHSWPESRGCGGVARSQWRYLPNSASQRDPVQTPRSPTEMSPLPPIPSTIPVAAQFTVSNGAVTFEEFFLPAGTLPPATLADALAPFASTMRANPELQLLCSVSSAPADLSLPTLLDALLAQMGVDPTELPAWRARLMLTRSPSPTPEPTLKIERFNTFALPGEHGFRFFPSFYRHVFDTMRRTPMTDTDGRPRGRDTVFDNLVSADYAAYVGDVPGPMALLARRKPRSISEVQKLISEIKRESGYTSRDMKLLGAKIWQYMTSSRMRREREYEHQSWYDFVGADRFSERGRHLIQTTPGTLVGLFGSDGEARTQGTILLQCMSDQFTDGEHSDMLLNGPTDDAWLGPWVRYLGRQNVHFIRGALDGFEFDAVNASIKPRVVRDRAREASGDNLIEFEPNLLTEGSAERLGKEVLFVIALPLLEAHEQALKFMDVYNANAAVLGPRGGPEDIQKLTEFPGFSPANSTPGEFRREMRQPYPRGPLKHLSGIQYFFNQELRLWKAHTQYLDASSGLTAIAQPQFWFRRQNMVSGYRSLLSVDIGIWSRPHFAGPPVDPGVEEWYPWGKTRQQIAERIWTQIDHAHAGDFPPPWPRMPFPTAYHIDAGLVFEPPDDPANATLSDDKTPFLVNETSRYRLRPGAVAPDKAPWKAHIRYNVALGRYVLAGIYMQTYTRITSMESACESGRHAVNALLEHLDLRGEKCEVWDPEDFESADLDALKRIDEELCARGLPHMNDITSTPSTDEWSWPEGGWRDLIEAATRRRR